MARHMAGRAGGSLSVFRASAATFSNTDAIEAESSFLGAVFAPGALAEARGLQLEHRAIPSAARQQLVMRAEFGDSAVFQNADAVGVAHGRESVRNENGGGVARGGEQPFKYFRLAAHVELRSGLVEQHNCRARFHGA